LDLFDRLVLLVLLDLFDRLVLLDLLGQYRL